MRGSPQGIVNLLDTHTVWQSCGMDTVTPANHSKNHRFPVEIISHAVWLSLRFRLRFREVEELRAERGVRVTSEAIKALSYGDGVYHEHQLIANLTGTAPPRVS